MDSNGREPASDAHVAAWWLLEGQPLVEGSIAQPPVLQADPLLISPLHNSSMSFLSSRYSELVPSNVYSQLNPSYTPQMTLMSIFKNWKFWN